MSLSHDLGILDITKNKVAISDDQKYLDQKYRSWLGDVTNGDMTNDPCFAVLYATAEIIGVI